MITFKQFGIRWVFLLIAFTVLQFKPIILQVCEEEGHLSCFHVAALAAKC